MFKGTVKWYNETKGFGFLVNTEDNKDVFVHRSGLVSAKVLEPGQAVTFDIKDGEKGPVAVEVELV